MHDRREVILGTTALATGLAFGLGGCETHSTGVTFAAPTPVWWNAVPLIASSGGFYSRAGITVLEFDVPTGVRSKQAIVDGNAQMGVAATNAISTSTDAELRNLRILASITQARGTVAIVSHVPAVQLQHSSIGYVKGTISEFHLISFLMKQGNLGRYRANGLRLMNLSPPNLVTAFANGEVDAVVAWEPFASQAGMQSRGGRKPLTLRDDSLYAQQIFLLASVHAAEESRNKVLGAIRDTCSYIQNNRREVAADLERRFKFPTGFLVNGPVWPNVRFAFQQDKEAIRQALNVDRALAREAGVAGNTGGPAVDTLLSSISAT